MFNWDLVVISLQLLSNFTKEMMSNRACSLWAQIIMNSKLNIWSSNWSWLILIMESLEIKTLKMQIFVSLKSYFIFFVFRFWLKLNFFAPALRIFSPVCSPCKAAGSPGFQVQILAGPSWKRPDQSAPFKDKPPAGSNWFHWQGRNLTSAESG